MKARRIRGAVATGVATLLLTTAIVAGSPTAAHATAADCENGRNGFQDISDAQTGTLVRGPLRFDGGVEVTLRWTGIAGGQGGFAKITGNTRPGDLVWMDWTQNGGTTWLQCGPFRVTAAGESKTSAARRSSNVTAYKFRACGDRAGQPHQCTGWW